MWPISFGSDRPNFGLNSAYGQRAVSTFLYTPETSSAYFSGDLMSPITVALTSSSRMSHVPLAALGYALRRANVLEPLVNLELPIKAIDHTPAEKLVTGLVLILAGGRALYQTNWLLPPHTRVAWPWGPPQFAHQS